MRQKFLGPKVLLIAILTAGLCDVQASDKQKQYGFGDGACEVSVSYDDEKVDETKLDNTVALSFGRISIWTGTDYNHPHSIDQLITDEDVHDFENSCQKHLEELRQTEILPLSEAETVKALRIDEQIEWCNFGAIKRRAFVKGADPAILNDFKPSNEQCGKFAEELKNPLTLQAFWRGFIVERCIKNADPAGCTSYLRAIERRRDADEAIKKYVIMAGWNNCSTKFFSSHWNRTLNKAKETALMQALETRFKLKVKLECDDAD